MREVKRFKLCVAILMMKKLLIGKGGVTDHNERLVRAHGFQNKHAQRGQVQVEGVRLAVPGTGFGLDATAQAHV